MIHKGIDRVLDSEQSGHSAITLVDRVSPWGKAINDVLLSPDNRGKTEETLRVILDAGDSTNEVKAIGFMTGGEAFQLGQKLTLPDRLFTLPPVEESLISEKTFNLLVENNVFIEIPESKGKLFQFFVTDDNGRRRECLVKKQPKRRGYKTGIQILDWNYCPILTVPGY